MLGISREPPLKEDDLDGKYIVLSFSPFLLPAVWNLRLMAGALAATVDPE